MSNESGQAPPSSKPTNVAAAFVRLARGIFELDGQAAGVRMPPMEGLRGLAVLLVFGVHFHALFGQHLPVNSATFAISSIWESIGHSGVDLFFLMSGFLIYGAVIGRKTPILKFMRRRVQRIYPTFLSVFAIYLVLSAVFTSENKIPSSFWQAQRYILENLLLLPGIINIVPVITVAWSLSYEIFFYLFLPLLVVLLAMRKWNTRIRPLFFSALAVVYLGFCFLGFYPRPRLAMFLAGIVLFDVLKHLPIPETMNKALDHIGILALTGTFALIYWIALEPRVLRSLPLFVEYSWTYREMVLFAGFFLFVLCCLRATGVLKAIFTWAPCGGAFTSLAALCGAVP